MSIIDIAKGFARTSKSKGFGEEMVGGWSSPSTVRYGTAGSDSSGGKAFVVLDGSDEPVTLACETPVKSGQRVSVVYQSGTYKVVALKQMTEDIDSVKESQAEQEEAISQISGQVEQARQQAQAAQQAAEDAGGRADDALEAAQQAAGDAQAGVAEAKQAAEEASERAEELAGQVSEVRTEVEGLSSTVSGAVDTAEGALSMATEVGQSLESYKVEASQTYLDKATGETLATKAELEAKADEITLAVSEEYATKGEAAQMAQPNLRPMFSATPIDHADNPDWWIDTNSTTIAGSVVPLGDGWAHVECDNSQGTTVIYVNYMDALCPSVEPGKAYTILVEIRGDEGETVGSVNFCDQNFVSSQFLGSYKVVGDGAHYKLLTAKDDVSGLTGCLRCLTGLNPGESMSFDCRISLYEGDYSGPYKPYAFDVSTLATKAELTVAEDSITAQVSEVATTADAAMSKATEVEQTAEGLSAEVSQVSQTAQGAVTQLASLSATVDGIESDVIAARETANSAVEAASSAQQDIDGFRTTVQQTYQTKADAGSAMEQERLDRQSAIEQSAAQIRQEVGQTYQPKGDYATTAQVSSAIDQRADEITLAVSQSYQPKGDYLTNSQAASTYASKSELSVAEESITSQVSEVAETASGAYSLASSVQQTAEGLEVEITAAQESAEEAAKTATSFLRVTQSGVQLARESGGNDPQINLNVSGAASYVDVAGIPSGAGGYRHARIDGSSLTLGTSGGAHSIEIDAESQTITAQSLQIDADIITLHSPAATLQASEHYGGLMVQAGGITGLLSDWVTARGASSDGEWRRFASGSWEYWLNYKNLSCKPNGTTNLTLPIPSAIGNRNANYVVLANFTMMGGSSLPDGWSKMAIGVVSQTASQFTLRIWGDNTFASPNLVMSINIHILGRA